MKKVLFVATVVKTHICTFHLPFLELFKKHNWDVSVAAKNDYTNKSDCHIPNCDNYIDIPFRRFPFSLMNIKAFFRLRKAIGQNKYDIIHCHTPVGGVLTRIAIATLPAQRKKTKVFYTAHGFHFYKGAPLVNWLLYFPIEWVLSFFTDVLITINNEDYSLACKYFKAKEIRYIPGVGVDTRKFHDNLSLLQYAKECKQHMSLLSVGELNKNKNHEVVIKALCKLKDPDVDYYIAGVGDQYESLKSLAIENHIESQVHFLGYCDDIEEILKMADVFILPSYREGLSLALMEAMSSGLPCIVSKIRGNVDLILDDVNGFTFSPDSVNELTLCISRMKKDKNMMLRMSGNNRLKSSLFDLAIIKEEYENLYFSNKTE